MCVPLLILADHSDHKIIIHEWLFKGLSMFPLTFWFGNYIETSKNLIVQMLVVLAHMRCTTYKIPPATISSEPTRDNQVPAHVADHA
jgi:hypothetical protein